MVVSKIINILISFLIFLGLSSCSQAQEILGFGPSEGSMVPTGEFIGTWRHAKGSKLEAAESEEVEEDREVKITLFPMKGTDSTSTGILVFNDRSQRFYWRANGDGNSFNILFTKDNNIYTDLTTGFSFDGVLKKNSIGLELAGSLREVNEEKDLRYFVKTYKVYSPEIVAGEEALAGTVGSNLTIQGNYLGESEEKISVKLTNTADAKEFSVKPDKVVKASGEEPGSLTIKLKEDLPKGDYTLLVVRGEGYESNSVSVSIN